MAKSIKNNKFIIGLTIIIISLIILLGIYYIYFNEPDQVKEEPEILFEVDDRISPGYRWLRIFK